MDERVLERMVSRSGTALRNGQALAFSFGGVLFTAIIWIVLRATLGGITGVFHLPILFVSICLASLPLACIIVPLSSWCMSVRSGHPSLPFHAILRQRWRESVALLLFALCCSVLELLLGVAAALWCGIEAIPVFGTGVYLLFSWIPAIITLLMGVTLACYAITLFSIGTILSRASYIETTEFWAGLPKILAEEWAIRIKLFVVSAIPSIILYFATTTWTMKGLPQSAEFCASLFRVIVFSGLEAPLFMFLIHMAVETDRYIQWLSSRRIG
jgi:hypothetical protein